MKEEVKRFLNSIFYEGEEKELDTLDIEKVILHKKEQNYEVIMHAENVLPYEIACKLKLAALNKIHGTEKCSITLKYDTISKESVLEYLQNILQIFKTKRPSLGSVFEGN